MLFTFLMLTVIFPICIYAMFYEKKNIPFLLFLTFLSVVSLNPKWSILGLLFLGMPIIFLGRVSFGSLASFCMLGAILVSYFVFNFFLEYQVMRLLGVAIVSIIFMCILAITAIFEDDLKRYLIYSNTVQLVFVVLDLSVAKMGSKLATLGTIQIFNYTFAGLLLFLSLGILGKGKDKISQLYGVYYKDKVNSTCAIIAALSLAGLPGLNIFVSEWLLFTTAFTITPVLTIFGIFIALLLFIMYFKLVYVLIVGKERRGESPSILTAINVMLAVICVVLGLIPEIQYFILQRLV